MSNSSIEPFAKRPRLAATIVATGLQLATQARNHGLSRRAVDNELHLYDKLVTPNGPLYTTLAVPGKSGQPLHIDCIDPFAFLWLAAARSPEAAGFFEKELAGKQCRLAFYTDSVTPGNVLRPDKGRTFEAVYWTFMELPDWFRSQASDGWFCSVS